MIKKKVLITAVVLGLTLNVTAAFAEPIVELAAPRNQAKVLPDDSSNVKTNKVEELEKEAQKATKPDSKKTPPAKKHKKIVKKKPQIVKVDYDKVSKLIEYGYYGAADRTLESAIQRNSKDIKAQALYTISLAKQFKLAPAQEKLDILMKKHPDNSDIHYAQGIVYYQRTTSSNMFYRNNYDKLMNDSMSEFQKAIKYDKNNAKAYNAAGVVSIKLGKTNDAKNYFKKAISVDKTYSMAIDNMGTLEFTEGKYKEAKLKFEESLKYNTQNTTAMYHLAQIALINNNYSEAITLLNDALYINTNSPAIYNLLGKAYALQGNEAAAINALKKSIEIKPEFTLSYVDLSDIYANRGDCEFALEKLKTALSIEPGYNEAKLKMADISLESGKYKQALDVYSELVGIEGYNDKALKGLANSYYAQAQISANKGALGTSKDLLDALNCINKAISATPDDLELYLAKLKLTKLTNQPDESLIVLNKIVQSKENDLMSNVVKGEAYMTLNDYDNAKKHFNLAISLSKSTQDDTYLSEIFIYNKQLDCAENIVNKILQNDATNQQAINNLEYIKKCKKYSDNYYKSGVKFLNSRNTSAAIEYFSRSIAINPYNAQAQLLLAQIFEKQRDYQEALAHYKAYLSLNPYGNDSKKIANKIKQLDNKL